MPQRDYEPQVASSTVIVTPTVFRPSGLLFNFGQIERNFAKGHHRARKRLRHKDIGEREAFSKSRSVLISFSISSLKNIIFSKRILYEPP